MGSSPARNPENWDVTSETVAEVMPLSRFAWGAMAAGLVLLWSPIFAAMLLSFVAEGTHIMKGIKPMAWAVDPLIYLGFYWAAVQFLLSFPVTQGYQQTRHFRQPAVRFLILFALMAAPLCSFAYYHAGKLTEGQWPEIFLAVVPACLVGTISYFRLEKRWLMSAWVALGSYVPLYLFNDLMGPFSCYFAYASRFDAFYWFRYLGPVLGVTWMGWVFMARANKLFAPNSLD